MRKVLHLPQKGLATPWERPCNCLRKAWYLPEKGLATAWERPGNCLRKAWQLPEKGLATAWERPGNCLRKAWQLSEKGLATAWERPGKCLRKAWHLPEKGVAPICEMPGMCQGMSICITKLESWTTLALVCWRLKLTLLSILNFSRWKELYLLKALIPNVYLCLFGTRQSFSGRCHTFLSLFIYFI